MKFDMYDVVNYAKWGRLLKEWAENEASRPLEGDIENLAKAMNKAEVEVSFVGRKYKTFKFVQGTKPDGDVLEIIMPPKEIIKQAADDLKTNDYQLPDFYTDTFGPLKIPEDKKETFHAQRIAEYVMKWCG